MGHTCPAHFYTVSFPGATLLLILPFSLLPIWEMERNRILCKEIISSALHRRKRSHSSDGIFPFAAPPAPALLLAAMPRTAVLGWAAAGRNGSNAVLLQSTASLFHALLGRAEHMCCYLFVLVRSIRANKNLSGRLIAEAADVAR